MSGLLAFLACRAAEPSPRVVVLGFGGLDARVLEAKIADGTLPQFAALRRQGAYGELASPTSRPTTTAWTTLAGGRPPEAHGVVPATAAGSPAIPLPVTSHLRRVPALWNIASAADRPVLAVAWPATWPAENVLGHMISEHTPRRDSAPDDFAVETGRSRTTFPPHLSKRPEIGARTTLAATALHLWDEQRPALTMLYLDGIEGRAHVDADRFLAELRQLLEPSTTLIVLSVPGPETVGTVHLAGPGIQGGHALQGARLVDLAPTVLALLDIPPASDLPGRVWQDAWQRPLPIRTAVSYEIDGAAARDGGPWRRPGYLLIAPSGEGSAQAAEARQRDLASLYAETGHLIEAAELYRSLIAQHPDDPTLHTHLAATYGALGLYDQATAHLDQALAIDPLTIAAYHQRGVLWERQGDTRRAVAEYTTALRYQRRHQPSRRALERLLGHVEIRPPRNPEEEQAARLIEQAVGEARKGDYDVALSLLDAAEDAAPPYVVTYQYRSFIYYLKGDIQEAVKALQLALMVEPNNALFLQNLKRLQAEPPRKPPKADG